MIYRRSVCLNFISPETIGNDSLPHRSVYPIRNDPCGSNSAFQPLSLFFFRAIVETATKLRPKFPVPKLARIRVRAVNAPVWAPFPETETSRISLIRVSSVAAYRLSDALHAREGRFINKRYLRDARNVAVRIGRGRERIQLRGIFISSGWTCSQ